MVDDVGRGMVNGRLAMTRSIGDLELKRYGVSAVPDVRKIKVKNPHALWHCSAKIRNNSRLSIAFRQYVAVYFLGKRKGLLCILARAYHTAVFYYDNIAQFINYLVVFVWFLFSADKTRKRCFPGFDDRRYQLRHVRSGDLRRSAED